MKTLKYLALSAIFPAIVFAQNQGDDLSLGTGANPIMCRVNEAAANLASADAKGNYFACDKAGRLMVSLSGSTSSVSTTTEDTAFANGGPGVTIFGVRQDASTNFTNADADSIPFSLSGQGNLRVNVTKIGQIANADDLLKVEDSASGDGAAIVGIGGKILTIPVSQATDGDWGVPLMNELNALYSDGVRRKAFTHTQPSVTTATSFTCAAANTARHFLEIQNNSAANIMINLDGGTLTGIVPTSSNLGIVLPPGSSYSTPPNAAPVTAVTCYQTSGSTINTISVIEQS